MIGAMSPMRMSRTHESRNGSGAITLDTPRITKIFIIHDPTTLPRAISLFPFRAAIMEVASSGALVPTAIIVKPISVSERLKLVAILTAPSTRILPPMSSDSIPPMIQMDALLRD